MSDPTENLYSLLDEEPKPVETSTEIVHVSNGLGALFQDDDIEDLTDEELDSMVGVSTDSDFGDPGWDAMTRQLIRASCAFTAQELLRGPPEPPYNGRFLIGDHHLEWDELISKHKRLCILASRNHGKTFFVDFAYPIWQIINNPRKSGFIFSATQDQAERILADIKLEIETNPKLEFLKPRVKDGWGSRYIRCANGHRVYARGFGTKVRGAHPHWIVVDDGLTDETQYSELVRNKQKDYFYAAITNMINPGGQIVVIGTPLHKSDLYSDLRENKEYKYAEYPAETNYGHPNNKALWPDRFPLSALKKIRREIGSIMYTREFLCKAVSDEMSLFPLFLFQGQDVEQFHVKLGMPLAFWKEVGVTIYMGVDFALSSNVGADYTVVFVLGKDVHGNRWIIDMHRKKGLPYQQQLSLINTVARKYDPALILLEDNQMQRIFGDELIRTTDLPIQKFTTGVQRNSFDKGVPSLRTLLENKKFRIPRGDAHSVEMTDIWIDEMRSFTWLEGKLQSVGGHDDCVLSIWICDQAVRMGGFTMSFGDEEDYANQSHEDMIKALTGETKIEESDDEEKKEVENLAIKQGWVPPGCTLEFIHILSLMQDGQDPCEGCNEDRKICKGRSKGSEFSLV